MRRHVTVQIGWNINKKEKYCGKTVYDLEHYIEIIIFNFNKCISHSKLKIMKEYMNIYFQLWHLYEYRI